MVTVLEPVRLEKASVEIYNVKKTMITKNVEVQWITFSLVCAMSQVSVNGTSEQSVTS